MNDEFRAKSERETKKPAEKSESLSDMARAAAEELAEVFKNAFCEAVDDGRIPLQAPEIQEAPPGANYSFMADGQPIRIAPFWAHRPVEFSEVQRLERALQEAESWLNGNTDRCQRCHGRVPMGMGVCPTCEQGEE